MNPEFQRYLWTEFSLQRLIVMPVLLAALFALAMLNGSDNYVDLAEAATAAFVLLAFFWGTRKAADSVISELRDGTWDAQRMSAQGAFAMTWAKIFGSTVYAWYGGLICLAAYGYVAFDPGAAERMRWEARVDPLVAHMPLDAIVMVLVAVTGQATALAAAMALLRKRRRERNVSVTFCHFVGFAVCGILYWYLFRDWLIRDTIVWFGRAVPAQAFVVLSAAAFMLWAMLAVMRLMRSELLYRVRPWAWSAFAVFFAAWIAGLAEHYLGEAGARPLLRLTLALLTVATFVYPAFFFEEKNQVALRAWFADLAKFRLVRAASASPAWAQLFLLTLALAAATAWMAGRTAEDALFERIASAQLPVLLGAGALFMLRDLALLLFLNMGRMQRRADASGLIYLLMLYVLAPLLANLAEADAVTAALVPARPDMVAITLISPAVQAAGMLALLAWRVSRRPAARPPSAE